MRSLALLSLLALSCAQPFDVPAPPPPRPVVLPGQIDLVLHVSGAPAAGGRAYLPAAGLSAVAGADGKVHLGGVPEGAYTLEASAAGSRLARIDRVAVFAGKATDLGVVALQSAGALRGTVTAAGVGAPGAVVFAPYTNAVALTAADGSYLLDGLPAGRHVVYAKLAGHALGRSVETELPGGGEAQVPPIALAPPGAAIHATLTGTARFEDLYGLLGGGIRVSLEGTGLAAETVDSGAWRIESVPEGRYTLRFTRTGFVSVTLVGVAAVAGQPVVVPDVVLRSLSGEDLDGDGIADAQDPDQDGDGVLEAGDAFPRDGQEWADVDGDGVGDRRDNCLAVFNLSQTDTDGNGVGDACQAAGGNRPPEIAFEGPSAVDEGQLLVLVARATNPDGDTVSLVFRDQPPGSVFEPDGNASGTFHFTPSFTQAGEWTFAVAATDGRELALASRQVLVADVPGGNLLPLLEVSGRTALFEGDLASLTVAASDPEGAPVAISLDAGPAGALFADHGDGTATFTWLTGFDDAGTVGVVFGASDGDAAAQATAVLGISDVNRAPVIAAPLRQAATVGVELRFTVTATDADGTVPSIAPEDPPQGATVTDNSDGTALFSWIPPAWAAADGGVNVTLVASDGQASARITTRVDVFYAPNRAPTLAVRGALSVDEGQTLTLDLEGTDPDGDAILLLVQSAPAGSAFEELGAGAGRFTFRPDYTQSGTYNVTFVATDSRAATLAPRVLTVLDVPAGPNFAPLVEIRGRTSLFEGDLASLSVVATDPERAPVSLSLVAAPLTALFADHGDGTAAVTWLTGYADAGTHTVTLRAFDGTASTDASVTLAVGDVNRPPVLTAPSRRSAIVGQELAFAVTATDPDGTIPTLRVLGPPPAGAAFTDNSDGTAILRWIPLAEATQDGGTDLLFAASDAALTVSTSTRVDVSPPANRAPGLTVNGPPSVSEGQTLILDLTATDPDGDSVILSAQSVPANAAFADLGAGAGRFTFSPDFTQAGGYSVTFIATDGSAATVVPRSIVVNDVPGNTRPTLSVGGARQLQESAAFDLSLIATDPDSPALALTVTGAPLAAIFVDRGDGTASFHWLTGYADAGTYPLIFHASDGFTEHAVAVSLIVDNVNRAPILAALSDRSVTAGANLNQAITATDADGESILLSVQPATRPGMSFTSAGGAGTFNFTPPTTDANSSITFTFSASDGQNAAQRTMRVNVLPAGANRAPVWDTVSTPLLDEGQATEINVRATDPDGQVPTIYATTLPADASLIPGGGGTARVVYAPGHGVALNGATQVVTFVLRADDGSTTTAVNFTVNVKDKNRAPVVSPNLDMIAGTGSAVLVTTGATDPDGPTTLTYLYQATPSLPFTQANPQANSATFNIGDSVSEGPYLVDVRVRDPGGAEGTDQFVLRVEKGHWVRLAAAFPPSVIDGVMVHDKVNEQLVVFDHERYPDRVWLMPLLADVRAQVWIERQFPAGQFPPATINIAGMDTQGLFVEDAGSAAMLLFRSENSPTSSYTDVWRLDLSPPGAEKWTPLDSANVDRTTTTSGCFTHLYYQTMLTWDAASERVLCIDIGEGAGSGTNQGAQFDYRAGVYPRWSRYTYGGPIQNTGFNATSTWGSEGKFWTVVNTSSGILVREFIAGAGAGSSTDIVTSNSPPGWANWSPVIHDEASNRLIVYLARGETWGFDLPTRAWSRLVSNNGDAAGIRNSSRMAYVPWQRRIYIGGGCGGAYVGSGGICTGAYVTDLWSADVARGASGF